MVLRLTHGVGGGDEGSEIGGRAKVCGADHDVTYAISGDALDYRGTRFGLNAERTDAGEGLYHRRLEGTWDGQDDLTVSTSLLRIEMDAAGTATAGVDPRNPAVTLTLRRATESDFAAACGA
ncbi:hypothetical protein [Asanoa siamensis]|nr:hypothetical protein [Asanoa siamensis]